MSRPPSPIDDAAPAVLLGGGLARVERLEFGKFCIASDGPVERDRANVPIEHGQLGRSSGFPSEVARLCDPSIMSVSAGETDTPPPGCPHATVLRPIVGGGTEARSVFYRVRTRPEAGEGRAGRRYVMARYLMAESADVAPLTLLNAMDSSELRGLTRAEASNLEPLSAFAERPVLSRTVEAFRRGAVTYVLSGVPVSILDNISEGEFFSCVAALWLLLPSFLRAHLSAGWGSGNYFSGRLAVTHTARSADDCALFSPSSLTWAPPQRVTTWDANYNLVRRPFFPQRLEPGNAYARYFLSGEGWPQAPSPSLDRGMLSLISPMPDFQFTELPDWQDPITVRAFRYPGLKARDEFAYARLERWLEGEQDDGHALVLDVRRSMTYESTRLRSLRCMQDALAQPGTRRRGSMALWASVAGRRSDVFLNEVAVAAGPGSALAQLLVALSLSDLISALRSLTLAAERGEADDLLPDALLYLQVALDASLNRVEMEELALHARLLRLSLCPTTSTEVSPTTDDPSELPLIPTAYTEWVRRSDLRLIRAFASMPGTFAAQTFSKIRLISGSPAACALYAMLFGGGLTEQWRAVVNGLSDEERRVFTDVLDIQWGRADGDVAARREHLLSWFRQLGVRNNSNPLLRLERGEMYWDERNVELSRQQFSVLADDVELAHVPPSLQVKVSAFVLEYWLVFRKRMGEQELKWIDVVKFWPRFLARVLGYDFAHAVHVEPLEQAVERVAVALSLPRDVLNELLAARLLQANVEQGLASEFWKLARQSSRAAYDIRPNAIELCLHLARGRLPDSMPVSRMEISNCVQLVHAAGEIDRLLESAQGWWYSAREGRQLLLLLRLFPHENFVPTAVHLGGLVHYHGWLSDYLNEGDVPWSRRKDFELATRPFHSLSFRQDAHRWSDSYTSHSVVWAAFSGVPVSMLPHGALADALEAYCRVQQAQSDVELRALRREVKSHMCLTFLQSYFRQASFEPGLRAVLFEFVLPTLRRWYGQKDAQKLFAVIRNEIHDARVAARRQEFFPRSEPTLLELLRLIVRNSDTKVLNVAVKEFYRS